MTAFLVCLLIAVAIVFSGNERLNNIALKANPFNVLVVIPLKWLGIDLKKMYHDFNKEKND